MNEHELNMISKWYGYEMDFKQQIKDLQQRFDIQTLIVSHGSLGAYCFCPSDSSGQNHTLYFQKALEIAVKDTIGSGDAFLAGFLAEKMKGKDPQSCLKTACVMGAYVATQAGATPAVDLAFMMSDFGMQPKSDITNPI